MGGMSSVSPGGDGDVEAWALDVKEGAGQFHGVVEIIFSERWSMCLVGVDTGVDEPALLNRCGRW
jgi:hypothetical protein